MSEEEKKDLYTEAQETIEKIEHKLGNITWALYVRGYTEKQIDKKIKTISDAIWYKIGDNILKRVHTSTIVNYDDIELQKLHVKFKTEEPELKDKEGTLYVAKNETHRYNNMSENINKRDGRNGIFYFTQEGTTGASVSYGVCSKREESLNSYVFNSMKKGEDFVDFQCYFKKGEGRVFVSFDKFRNIEAEISPELEEPDPMLYYTDWPSFEYIPVAIQFEDGSYEKNIEKLITQYHFEKAYIREAGE